ncbi:MULTISPECIES: GNAT family N-acetyltransferase [Microbacterium]|uniref:GNAT family N-acetyltransferase n=1 Tax=Microbacterium TaxID=33882 RepID=UPI002788FC0F|nr:MULTISPECIES: GNAT family N-acetyltransferase [Microbacterium]MDQ1085342.1 GNAT superfamily N-acetyltransferase [Microbacterium sp. SORGH_AS_0344]MDQ1169352.1 GNAT superfamily N-acetyltransferase [Microbacterium proteolyticum]
MNDRPFHIARVDVDDPRAVSLRRILDADLDERYRDADADDTPEIAAKRAAALAVHPEQVVATLLAMDADGAPLGHVILRRLGHEWELKRLVVVAAARRRGVGRKLTAEVLDLARREGARRVILQSGRMQPESLELYAASGFTPIPVYEPYAETMPRSLCFEYVM